MKPVPVIVPKETVSDDEYRFVHCVVGEGAKVRAGDLIATLETSKSAFDLHSPADGYLFLEHTPGDVVKVGATLAWITSEATRPAKPQLTAAAPGPSRSVAEASGPRISKAARALMEEQRLTPEDFAHLSSVTRDDVVARIQHYVGAASPGILWSVDPAPNTFDKNVFIHGGGGHAKMCIDLLRAAGGWHIVGILDSDKVPGSTVLGVRVLGVDSDDALKHMAASGVRFAVTGIGLVEKHHARHRLYDRMKAAGFELPNLVHPSATVEASARMGEGNQIMAHAVLGSDTRIGDGCIINTGSLVSHDCQIADHVHIAPGAVLAGGVNVGSNTLIGMGATIYMRLRIGSQVVILNGVNVHGDVEDDQIVRC